MTSAAPKFWIQKSEKSEVIIFVDFYNKDVHGFVTRRTLNKFYGTEKINFSIAKPHIVRNNLILSQVEYKLSIETSLNFKLIVQFLIDKEIYEQNNQNNEKLAKV